MDSAHSKPVSEVLRHFEVNENCGVSSEQVRRSREKYGPNGIMLSIIMQPVKSIEELSCCTVGVGEDDGARAQTSKHQ
uniref:Cation-transporting P-type ATPase N-terminal domain-containing protein n=1 Tax=Pyxicephalus adspersus TaxID=30357 RepID=A0AAV3B1S9_PYXAD|nr:TPA: hypothetical protein GDO54_001052 [Pyxicephalus adspersus]